MVYMYFLYTDSYTIFRGKIINVQYIPLRTDLRQVKTILLSTKLHFGFVSVFTSRYISKYAPPFMYSGKMTDFFFSPIDNPTKERYGISVSISCFKSNL